MTEFSIPNLPLEATGEGGSGQKINLGRMKGTFVVYFYPKDDTPGCTLQGKEWTALHNEIKAGGAEVFGVSRDSLKSHENFKRKYKYSFELISDPAGELHRAFDVLKKKNLYGKSVTGVERSTFCLRGGKVIKEWRKVKPAGHAQEVLDFLKTLKKRP